MTQSYTGCARSAQDDEELAIPKVADLAPGPSWPEPTDLLWDSERAVLVFSASDGLHGREPWEWLPGDALRACSPSPSAP